MIESLERAKQKACALFWLDRSLALLEGGVLGVGMACGQTAETPEKQQAVEATATVATTAKTGNTKRQEHCYQRRQHHHQHHYQ